MSTSSKKTVTITNMPPPSAATSKYDNIKVRRPPLAYYIAKHWKKIGCGGNASSARPMKVKSMATGSSRDFLLPDLVDSTEYSATCFDSDDSMRDESMRDDSMKDESMKDKSMSDFSNRRSKSSRRRMSSSSRRSSTGRRISSSSRRPCYTTAADDISTEDKVCLKPAAKTITLPLWMSSLPPFHTCALIMGLWTFFWMSLPSMEDLDDVATMETFAQVQFDQVISLNTVIAIRLALAAIMLGNAASVYLFGSWEADTDYFPGSKLEVAKRIPFRGALTSEGNVLSGFKCIATFTLWCWILEGVAFFMAGMIPLLDSHCNVTVAPWMLRTALVAWETAAPVSILVSAVVKYALWPMALEHGENVKLLKAPGALLQHNLNTVAALVEVGLLGGLPVQMSHFAFPPLYGLIYLMFSYAMMYCWADEKKGPQFFYPFFDTTLGANTSLSLVALLAMLSCSFCIFCGAGALLTEAPDSNGAVPILAICLLSTYVCRFWD